MKEGSVHERKGEQCCTIYHLFSLHFFFFEILLFPVRNLLKLFFFVQPLLLLLTIADSAKFSIELPVYSEVSLLKKGIVLGIKFIL